MNMGNLQAAQEDLQWVLEHDPDDYTRSYVDKYLQMIDQQNRQQ
jgi:hypothetical protein